VLESYGMNAVPTEQACEAALGNRDLIVTVATGGGNREAETGDGEEQ